MLSIAKHCLDDWDGTVSIEYALIAGLISMAVVAALTALGPTLNDAFFTSIAGTVSAAAP
jgi:Flp pilus assembly pilin Flp